MADQTVPISVPAEVCSTQPEEPATAVVVDAEAVAAAPAVAEVTSPEVTLPADTSAEVKVPGTTEKVSASADGVAVPEQEAAAAAPEERPVVSEVPKSDDAKEDASPNKRDSPDGGHAEEDADHALKTKKPRVTRATIRKHINKGKLLENQIFTWRDWSPIDDREQIDVVFTSCKMKVEVKNANGEVVLKPKQSVRRIEMYTSKSIMVFYTDNTVANSIICPMKLEVLQSLI